MLFRLFGVDIKPLGECNIPWNRGIACIPYREFEEVLGIKGIDEYIRYDGTMSFGGMNYNADTTFSNSKSAEAYIDTAIAKNIQHSLKMYQYGGHFRQRLDLYERRELTNVINRVVENMLLDAKFQELSVQERQRVLDRLLNEIRGRMMEDIILLETKIANPDKKVFKLQFTVGEFDMVVFNPKSLTCQIYEVKYSKEQVPEQYRHLKNEQKCAMTSHRYGDITDRYVIYRGEKANVDGVQYMNVEEYLNAL